MKARSISNVRKRDGKPNGGVIAQKTYWRGAAHSNSEDSIGTGNHAKREKNKNENPISRQRGRNGRVRDFADTARTKRNTEHIKEIYRCGQSYIAREKDGIQTVAGDEVYHLGKYGDTNKAGG